ncbi:MAG: signal peptidase I, partial [Planctomycetota bacterium]
GRRRRALLHERPVSPAAMSDSNQSGSVKETLISIIISLAMALVAKAYVIEAFVIPTGSMAPTLLGKHMLFESPETGYDWAVNPWFYARLRDGGSVPTQPQAGRSNGRTATATVTDPMTTSQTNPTRRADRAGYTMTGEPKRLRAGDRILVQKMLYELFGPERYDVVVFKNPTDPNENFIKRLVGLPGEVVFLVDGDCFTAPTDDRGAQPDEWDAYQIRRKPVRVQRDLWRPVFSSEFTPPNPVDSAGRRFFVTPWSGEGWTTADERVYETDVRTPTTIAWDTDLWPLNDFNPYNEVPGLAGFQGGKRFLDPDHYYPVADLRLRAGVEAGADGLRAGAQIAARGHVFAFSITDSAAELTVTDPEGATTALASGPGVTFSDGRTVEVEFWHWDQRLALYVDGEKLLEGDYDWDAAQRMVRSTGVHPSEITSAADTSLESQGAYGPAKPGVSWSFAGAPVRLHRVGLDKDIYWRPDDTRRACHPIDKMILRDDQFFVLGDNAAASADGRKWNEVHPEVQKIDSTVGVVPERLMLGKAFFVYFPSPHNLGRIPIPDLGRMRSIN